MRRSVRDAGGRSFRTWQSRVWGSPSVTVAAATYTISTSRAVTALTVQPMARAIVMLKYQQVTPLAGWFAERLLPVVRENAAQFTADVVVPVPLHPARRQERGYNQAELIARFLAKQLKLPCRADLLVRTQPRPEKLRLTVRERWHSVRNAFDIREGAQVDKLRVLLLDDVLTTGATLDACSRALREAGAAYVAAITVARAMPRSQGLETQPLPRSASDELRPE